nr:hypothetical protein [Tanacetum cinerariifolium]
MSAMLGVDEPENILIENLNLRKVKGTGCFLRIKRVVEVTAEELAKRRTYGVCGGKEGHNKRTYTNEPASKKYKVHVAPKEKAAPKQQASQPRRSRLRSNKLHIYKDKIKELLNQAEIDVAIVLKVSSKVVMSAMIGVDEPENVLIENLNLRKVKGTGCFSRIKRVVEVTAKELAKRRTYGVCGGKEGHNKRTYTNEPASKKSKVQVAPKEKAAPKQQASQPRRSRLRSSTPK